MPVALLPKSLLQYTYMIKSLRDRMLRLQARHYHALHSRPHQQRAGAQLASPAAGGPAPPAAAGAPAGTAPAQGESLTGSAQGHAATQAPPEGQGSEAAASSVARVT